MAAPVSFRERSDSFPLHRGRRPYMALGGRVGMSAFRESTVEGMRTIERTMVIQICLRTGGARVAIMDLGGWLRSLGLEQYEAAFRAERD